MKIRVFVGCSTNRIEIAKSIRDSLDAVFETTLWNEGEGDLSVDEVNSLLSGLERHDIAVFVIESNELSVMDGKVKFNVDDSVFYEIGLFMGNLGKERTFIILPEKAEGRFNKLPFDILGKKNFIKYKDNDAKALGKICGKVQKRIIELGARSRLEIVQTQKDVFTYVLNCLTPNEDLNLTRVFFEEFKNTNLTAIQDVLPPLKKIIHHYVKEFIKPGMRVYFAYRIISENNVSDSENAYRLGISYDTNNHNWNEYLTLGFKSNVHIVYENKMPSGLDDVTGEAKSGIKMNQEVGEEESVYAYPVIFKNDRTGDRECIGVVAVSSAQKEEATELEYVKLANELSVLFSALFYAYGISLLKEMEFGKVIEKIRTDISRVLELEASIKQRKRESNEMDS